MSDNAALRKQLVENLRSSNAHANFDQSIKDFPAELHGKRPDGAPHSPWQVLEHLRIAQWDILEFSRDAKHKSPAWPEGYWPPQPEPPDEKAWDRSVHRFSQDNDALCKLIEDESSDLFAKLPHGDGQTLLREALLAADHNAYHLGQLVLLRRMLGSWNG
jgi:DinB superfamily